MRIFEEETDQYFLGGSDKFNLFTPRKTIFYISGYQMCEGIDSVIFLYIYMLILHKSF